MKYYYDSQNQSCTNRYTQMPFPPQPSYPLPMFSSFYPIPFHPVGNQSLQFLVYLSWFSFGKYKQILAYVLISTHFFLKGKAAYYRYSFWAFFFYLYYCCNFLLRVTPSSMFDKLIHNVEFTGFSLAPSYTANVFCKLNFCILLIALSDFQKKNIGILSTEFFHGDVWNQ